LKTTAESDPQSHAAQGNLPQKRQKTAPEPLKPTAQSEKPTDQATNQDAIPSVKTMTIDKNFCVCRVFSG